MILVSSIGEQGAAPKALSESISDWSATVPVARLVSRFALNASETLALQSLALQSLALQSLALQSLLTVPNLFLRALLPSFGARAARELFRIAGGRLRNHAALVFGDLGQRALGQD